MMLVSLVGCTSTRKLTKKFSVPAVRMDMESLGGRYSNKGIDGNKTTLWERLSNFAPDQDSINAIPEDAEIRLDFNPGGTLKASVIAHGELTESLSIPVKKRHKHLILQNKTRVIPIPFLYFEIKEKKTVLALLENGHLGFSYYDSHSLWILVMAAGDDSAFTAEYERLTENEGKTGYPLQNNE